jgi:hypothetical protein
MSEGGAHCGQLLGLGRSPVTSQEHFTCFPGRTGRQKASLPEPDHGEEGLSVLKTEGLWTRGS